MVAMMEWTNFVANGARPNLDYRVRAFEPFA